MSFCWHRWEKWGEPQEAILKGDYYGTKKFVIVQQRRCEKCGIIQLSQINRLDKLLKKN